MLTAILDTFAAGPGPNAILSEIAKRFNLACAEELGRPMTNKWVGSYLRRRLRLPSLKSGGVYAVPASAREQVVALAPRYGVTTVA
jgi:hypothetical protein